MEHIHMTPAPPAELPDDTAPDLTIDVVFQAFDPNDPPLRATAALAVHALGLLITGFEIRQWPGVNSGFVRVDFPKSTGQRRSIVAWNLRLRDLIAASYAAAIERRHRAGQPVACCELIGAQCVAAATPTGGPLTPPLFRPPHSAACPHANRWVGELGRGVWSVDDLECLAAQLLDTFAAGQRADVCRTLARLTPIEAALTTVRILAPAPFYADAAPEINPTVLTQELAAALDEAS